MGVMKNLKKKTKQEQRAKVALLLRLIGFLVGGYAVENPTKRTDAWPVKRDRILQRMGLNELAD